MNLKDEQWELVKPLLPQSPRRADGKGRPRVDDRAILNGILWILRTGARWGDMPDRYPPYQTCHRRFQGWVRAGVFEQVLRRLVTDVKERGGLDLTECFIEGTFVVAKKGAVGWEKPSGARVASSWQWQMALVFLSPYPLQVLRRMKSDWPKAGGAVPLRVSGWIAAGHQPLPHSSALVRLRKRPGQVRLYLENLP